MASEQPINGQVILMASEIIAGQGEDSFAAEVDACGGLLCVADGCGGIGARRYEKLENQTEAYIAARLAVDTTRTWAASLDGQNFPAAKTEAQLAADQLRAALAETFSAFHGEHHNAAASRVIIRGLQRTLPTTLCAVLMDARADDTLALLFFWAGDSRGYVLTADGLRQCTADHITGHADALENLYRDARLTNMVNADSPFQVDVYGFRQSKPCVVLLATDGAFGYLPTPMEFELLLLETLQAAKTLDGWRNRLNRKLSKIASDDSTLVIACFGFESFQAMRAYYAHRYSIYKATYITPIRRRKQSIAHARSVWATYRQTYEVSEEMRDADWRL